MKMRKSIALIASTIAALTLVGVGSASAHNEETTLTGTTKPPAVNGVVIPGLNQGQRASFEVVDDGRSITITGEGRGLGGNRVYVSLIYKNNACSDVSYNNSGLSAAAIWQDHGDNRQTLTARYEGAAYRAVRDEIESISVREITSVVIPPPNGIAAVQFVPRACADVT